MAWNEEQFLEGLEQNPIPADALSSQLRAAPWSDDIASYAQLLEEQLAGNKQYREALKTLCFRAGLADGKLRMKREELKKAAEQLLKSDVHLKKIPGEVGFDQSLPPAECMRRLLLLADLEKDSLCYDATWGFGVVQRVDSFYKKVAIDFDRKKGHELSFAYAAETLQLLPEQHILARFHRDPEGVAEQTKKEPGRIVRNMIESFGPMTVEQLQEKVTAHLLPADGWKSFWEGARRDLKKDPLVDIPSRRTEPLRILTPEERYGEIWFERLASERDMAALLRMLNAFRQDEGREALTEERGAVVGERLTFVIKGAGYRKLDLLVQAVLLARAFDRPENREDVERYLKDFLSPARLKDILEALPLRLVGQLLRFLHEADAEHLEDTLNRVLCSLNVSVFNECVDFLFSVSRPQVCEQSIRRVLDAKEASAVVLLWVLKNRERAAEWKLADPYDLARMVIGALEEPQSGDLLKAQNQLREWFGGEQILSWLLNDLTALRRQELFQRIRESSAWPSLDRNAVLARMVKIEPSLERILVEEAEGEHVAGRGPVTSWRSYNERRRQLEKLVQVDIPQNSRDIAEARAHGDLRENFEYKAAKEMQTVLLRRQAEFEKQLSEVQGTDFDDMAADTAGPATTVTLAFDDGRRETYSILGEWDRDEALRIISSNSQMAKALEGRASGEAVTVPGENGPEHGILADVQPLSAEVRQWMREGSDT